VYKWQREKDEENPAGKHSRKKARQSGRRKVAASIRSRADTGSAGARKDAGVDVDNAGFAIPIFADRGNRADVTT